MIYYYILMGVYACLRSGGKFCHYARMRYWYGCGFVAIFQGHIIPISHNAIFDDLRHFYIFMCISTLMFQNRLYKAMRKAVTRKNATGRSAPKIERNRTLCEIKRKPRANFEKNLF